MALPLFVLVRVMTFFPASLRSRAALRPIHGKSTYPGIKEMVRGGLEALDAGAVFLGISIRVLLFWAMWVNVGLTQTRMVLQSQPLGRRW